MDSSIPVRNPETKEECPKPEKNVRKDKEGSPRQTPAGQGIKSDMNPDQYGKRVKYATNIASPMCQPASLKDGPALTYSPKSILRESRYTRN